MARRGVRFVWFLMSFALLLSLFLAVYSLGLVNFQTGELQSAKNYASSLLDYNLSLARELGIPSRDTRVNLAYRNLQDSITSATNSEEIYHIVLTEMSKFERIIREQAYYNLTNWLDWVVNQDPNLCSLENSTDLKISFLAEQKVAIEGGDFLDQSTIDMIANYSLPGSLRLQTVTIAIEVNDDIVMTRVKEPLIEQDPVQHLQNQYLYLEQEYSRLQSRAGAAELTGPGLIINLMDAEDDLINDAINIIHDIDVQEVVHSLYASGALGIAVGDRRLVATSSIRCVGGPILVNYEPVPVKPLKITAVGDPEAMHAYLEPLLEYYLTVRKLRVEVIEVEELRLPAHNLR